MKRFIVSLAFILTTLAAVAPAPVTAVSPTTPLTQFAACGAGVANFLGFEPWYACLQQKYGSVKIGALNDVWLVVFPLIEDVIKAMGYTAAGFIIWGGIKYIKGQGESSQIEQARQIITNAVAGLVICLLSVALVQFIAGGLG